MKKFVNEMLFRIQNNISNLKDAKFKKQVEIEKIQEEIELLDSYARAIERELKKSEELSNVETPKCI